MPYDPDHCSFDIGSVRQRIYADLDAKDANGHPVGICYSCSIKCHPSHNLVELFTKRNFACDCGTTRMKCNGACSIRSKESGVDLDIPCSTNRYCHNFEGKFCSCNSGYDPESETSKMHQCLLGDACNEDWYHEECILGLQKGSGKHLGTKIFDGEDDDSDDEEDDRIEGIPAVINYSNFICWKCVQKHRHVLGTWSNWKGVALPAIIHVENKTLEERWKFVKQFEKILPSKPFETARLMSYDHEDIDRPRKRIKLEDIKEEEEDVELIPSTPQEEITSKTHSLVPTTPTPSFQFSLFLAVGFREKLYEIRNLISDKKNRSIAETDFLAFITEFPFMIEDEPIYEPPEDEDTSSTFDAGLEALNSLPRAQALEGLYAYNIVKDRLSNFLRPFAEQGKIVTTEEVEKFFTEVKEEQQKAGTTEI